MMMPGELRPRKVQVVELSYMEAHDEILHPEFLALKLSTRVSPLDIGVYAYAVRVKVSARSGSYLVDESSLIPSRRKMIVSLLDKFWLSGVGHGSIETDIKNFDYAIGWCDANGHGRIFCDSESARIAYMDFSNHLYQEVLKDNGMAPLTCQSRQAILRRVLELQFPDVYAYIVAGIPPVKHRREGLDPPGDEEVKKYIDISLNIALSFSRFLVDFSPFPLRFETAEYHTYIFPGTGKYITPYTEGGHRFSAYNYKEGRLLTISELKMAKPSTRLADIRETLARAQRLIDDVNAYSHHQFRMRLAALAMKAYACLINLVVGANSGEVIQFLYDDAVELVKSPLKNELSAIKLRAKGLEVTYSVGRGPGMRLLREYFKFRDWVLMGRKCDYLFFHVLDGRGLPSDDFSPLETNFSTKFYNKLQGVFVPKTSKNIPPLLIRKYKSLALHQLKHSPLLVSAIMNHSEHTNAQSYSGITVKDQKSEIGSYWAAVKGAAERARKNTQATGVSIAVGHCDEINSPSKDIAVVAIEPDCKKQYGCLFCIHYLVHSDEADIHKLISFQYVIEAIRANAPNFEFSEDTFRDVAIRINAILEAVSQRSEASAELVVSIREKVFDLGILTPFWERRLQRYEKMGIYI
ncbi:hypothetical protein [Ectopseudomonas oleovorans]|nr:hypothetical protein [Pseudomonas indoloxydans]